MKIFKNRIMKILSFLGLITLEKNTQNSNKPQIDVPPSSDDHSKNYKKKLIL